MKISFECADKINGLLTITVEETDFKENVEKRLKEYRKKANIPGFRPGMVPLGLLRKQAGPSIKVEEINKLLGEKMFAYMKDNNIDMLGEPLPNEKQTPVDLDAEPPYTFMFDVAVAPECNVEFSDKDSIDYYTINVDDKMIDGEISVLAANAGHRESVQDYQDNDLVKGTLCELDEKGNTKENGITVDEAIVMPSYFKKDDQRKIFEGTKVGDIVTINPKRVYPDSDTEIASLLKVKKEDVADLTSDFSFQINEIMRYVKAEVNQELFDKVYGKGVVKDEKEFREKIAEGLKGESAIHSEYKFMLDVRKYAEAKAGKLVYPETMLKRLMLAGNKDKGQEYVDKYFDEAMKGLNWNVIKHKIMSDRKIEVEDSDVRETAVADARAQFAEYGMRNVPEEYIKNYASKMVEDKDKQNGLIERTADRKLAASLKKTVKINWKTVTIDEFNKLMEEA